LWFGADLRKNEMSSGGHRTAWSDVVATRLGATRAFFRSCAPNKVGQAWACPTIRLEAASHVRLRKS